jgi:hypothetical protein
MRRDPAAGEGRFRPLAQGAAGLAVRPHGGAEDDDVQGGGANRTRLRAFSVP